MTLGGPAGGVVFSARGAKDLVPQAMKIANEIQNQYVLTYTSLHGVRDGALHELNVTVPLDVVAHLTFVGPPSYYSPR